MTAHVPSLPSFPYVPFFALFDGFSSLLQIIITALGALLSVCAKVEILLQVIVDVALGECLCELISAVLAIVPGLLLELVPLVLGLVGVILSLGLDVVGRLLTIC